MAEITIHVDHDRSDFVLLNCVKELTEDKRLVMSLKRLGFQTEESNILIPFEENTKISTLSEIQHLLVKFGFSKALSSETIEDVKNFEREERLFGEFSNKARTIRNDEFDKYPELVEDFKSFKFALEKNLKRNLYHFRKMHAILPCREPEKHQ